MFSLRGGDGLTRVKLVLVVAAALLFVGLCDPFGTRGQQQPPKSHVLTWKPTRPTPGGQYVGAQACAECHQGKLESYSHNSMSRALERVSDCQILRANPRLTYKLGPYTYQITREGDQSIYSVTDGVNTISEPILHCFGQGTAGQTYVLKHKGSYYESRLSYYNDIKGLDITIGYPREPPKSLPDALGRLTGIDEIRSCYGCHATNSARGTELQLDKLIPGVSCEACHGPGDKHVAAMKSGNFSQKHIFNPGGLGADVLSQEFCASCHRSAEEVALMPDQAGINNVRFQPYRIFNSPCYADDARISCTACHNPHQELKREVSFYDAKCFACHQSKTGAETARFVRATTPQAAPSGAGRTAPPCPVETKNCASCHMPKIELPGSHTAFTDHRIRVVKPGEPFPK